jgi:heme oxygenase
VSLASDARVDAGDDQLLAPRIRSETASEHRAAEASSFIAALLGGELSLDHYARYLAQFAWIYEALESPRWAVDDCALFDGALARSANIQHDLIELGVADWRIEHPAMPATTAYVARLNEIASGALPHRIAHHYTRYLGDLSGGQAISRLVARHYGARPGQLTFFEFDGIENLVQYKRSYRQILDDLPLRNSQADELIAEVRLAYRLNSDLFDELGER